MLRFKDVHFLLRSVAQLYFVMCTSDVKLYLMIGQKGDQALAISWCKRCYKLFVQALNLYITMLQYVDSDMFMFLLFGVSSWENRGVDHHHNS